MELAVRLDAPALGKRVMPHDLDAERSVVGGILLHPKALPTVLDAVAAGDFYHPAHAAIFAAMVELDQAGKPVDTVTVAEQMRASESMLKLRAFNGEAYFAELMDAVVTVENIAFHARMVRGKARVRRLLEAAQEIAAHCFGEYGEVDECLALAEASILEVTTSGAPRTAVRLGDAVSSAVRERVEIAEGKREAPGLPSSLPRLNAILNGYRAGRIVLVVAGTSIGKSALVMQELVSGAIEHGAPSLVISCEMAADDLAVREVAAAAEVEGSKFDKGKLDGRGWGRVYRAEAELRGLPVEIDDQSQTLPEIVASIRRWHAERMREHAERCRAARVAGKPEPALPVLRVGVDYAQLVDGVRQKGENETSEQARVSTTLTKLAKRLGLCLIVAAQYKKTYDGTKEPTVNDVYGAGQYTKDAHTVILLHVEPGDVHKRFRPTLAIVAKNRGGDTGKVSLDFNRPITRFVEAREDALVADGWHPNEPGEA